MNEDEMNQEQRTENPAPQTKPQVYRQGFFERGGKGGPGRKKKILTAQELLDKQIRHDLKAVAKDHSPEAFRFLLSTMRDTTVGIQHRLSAATNILDRGWGKPTNQTEIKIDVYEKMSDVELIKLITGKEIEGEIIEAARSDMDDDSMTIEHESNNDARDTQDESHEP